MALSPVKTSDGIYQTKGLSGAAFRAAFDQIRKEQNVNRRFAKNTITPSKLNAKRLTAGQLQKFGKKAGGEYLTMADVKAMAKRNKAFIKANHGNTGITAAELISHSLDIDVARANNAVNDGRGITSATPMSVVKGDILECRVKASSVSKHESHRVRIRLVDMSSAMLTADNDAIGYRKAAKTACAGRLQIDCDCGRHQFWYRYMACAGGYALTPPKENAFPKIRNPKMKGLACKHVLKVAALLNTGSWQAVIAKEIGRQANRRGFGDDKAYTYHIGAEDQKLAHRGNNAKADKARAEKAFRQYQAASAALADKLTNPSPATSKLQKQLATAKARIKRQTAALNKAKQIQGSLLHHFIKMYAAQGKPESDAINAFAKLNKISPAEAKKLL